MLNTLGISYACLSEDLKILKFQLLKGDNARALSPYILIKDF